MRFVKAGAIAVALACSTVAGAGAAQADQIIVVNAQLLTCALDAGVNLGANVGLGLITVSDQVYADLHAAGCLH
ncbi:hypothetical protein [Nocardia amamiensis]|uniref:Uncharacterized protein n=1 Tax=Nocardia amamiensis TaxID=404578 RepID=A0ABS0CVN8_9NOCA|nr:hypothetical protein [Nocardia amamiensis]MBF6300652.1 hypothetical protein [Nocardia amamiensis]